MWQGEKWIPSFNSQSWKVVFLVVPLRFCIWNKWQQNWEVVCTEAQMSLIKGKGNKLPTPQSAFHHWPAVLPLFTASHVFFSQLPLHAITSVMPAFIEPILLKAQLPILGDRVFLPHNWAVTVMHMTSEIRFLFRSSYRGCLPTSPSIYPAPRPASRLSPVLWCTSWSMSAAARTGLPWNYATGITFSNDCLVKKRLQNYNK